MYTPPKFQRTADLRTPPSREILRRQARDNKSGSTVHHSVPPHEMYRGAGMDIKGTDYAGEYDTNKAIRCDCGANRTEHLDRCYRCGDTNPPEYR